MTPEIGANNPYILDEWLGTEYWTTTSRGERMVNARLPEGTGYLIDIIDGNEYYEKEVTDAYLAELVKIFDTIQDFSTNGGLIATDGRMVEFDEKQVQSPNALDEMIGKRAIWTGRSIEITRYLDHKLFDDFTSSQYFVLVKKGFNEHVGYSTFGNARMQLVYAGEDTFNRQGVFALNYKFVEAFTSLIKTRTKEAGLPNMLAPKSAVHQLMVDVSIETGIRRINRDDLTTKRPVLRKRKQLISKSK